MSVKTVAELRQKFETGDKPTAQDFIDLIDSFLHSGGSNFPNPLPAVSGAQLLNIGDALPSILPPRDGSQLTNINPQEYNVPAGMPTPSYATATTFVLLGDWTGTFKPSSKTGLRVRLTINGSYEYTEVTDATFAAGVTTVTVLDAMSSNLLTAAAVGVIRPIGAGGCVSETIVADGKPLVKLLTTSTDTIEIVNSAAEADLFRYTVPANTLRTNRALRLTLFGDYFNNTGAQKSFTLRVKYGGTTWASGPSGGKNQNVARKAWVLHVLLFAKGATNAQVGYAKMEGNTLTDGLWATGAPLNTENFYMQAASYAIAVDSTQAQDFAVTFQHQDANANESVKVYGAFLEKIG